MCNMNTHLSFKLWSVKKKLSVSSSKTALEMSTESPRNQSKLQEPKMISVLQLRKSRDALTRKTKRLANASAHSLNKLSRKQEWKRTSSSSNKAK
jgi:hypothetical protein